MSIEVRTITEGQAGCWLDNHRGHYIVRDMILLAADEFGYILDPFTRYAVDHYEQWPEDSPDNGFAAHLQMSLTELADDVRDWLNGGPNEGKDRAIKGQNSPPTIPEGYAWDWFDGDFGLYVIDEFSD